VKSKTAPEFWQRYGRLSAGVRRLANRCHKLWKENPRHPSLRFKELRGHEDLYSVRIGDHYRAVAQVKGDTAVWVWIGSHEEYNKLLRNR
jgi:mRNA-degrading endonuclease RelE of RelBE toxin-antitoxin system